MSAETYKKQLNVNKFRFDGLSIKYQGYLTNIKALTQRG